MDSIGEMGKWGKVGKHGGKWEKMGEMGRMGENGWRAGNVSAPGTCWACRAKFPPISPELSHLHLHMMVIHPGGLLFVCSHFGHHDMFPAHNIVHYTRSTGDVVSFVLWVPGPPEASRRDQQASRSQERRNHSNQPKAHKNQLCLLLCHNLGPLYQMLCGRRLLDACCYVLDASEMDQLGPDGSKWIKDFGSADEAPQHRTGQHVVLNSLGHY